MPDLRAYFTASCLLLAGCSTSTPPQESALRLGPLVLPQVSCAQAVSAGAFLVPAQPPAGEDGALSPQTLDMCRAGTDLAGNVPMDFAVIQVGTRDISLSGRPLVQLQEGHLTGDPPPPHHIQSIPTLHDALQAMAAQAQALVEQGCAQEQSPTLLLAVDARVPSTTVTRVLQTVGEEGFSSFHFLVDSAPENPALCPADPTPTPAAGGAQGPLTEVLVVSLHPRGILLQGPGSVIGPTGLEFPCAGATCASSAAYDLDGLRAALVGIKAQNPLQQTVVMATTGGVPHAAFMATAAVCAGTPQAPLFPIQIPAQVNDDDGVTVPLPANPVEGQLSLTPETVLRVLTMTRLEIVPAEPDPWDDILSGDDGSGIDLDEALRQANMIPPQGTVAPEGMP